MRPGGRQNFCRPPVRIALDDAKMGNISKILINALIKEDYCVISQRKKRRMDILRITLV